MSENQIVGMINNDLKHKNEMLMKQNIKLRENLKGLDENLNSETTFG